MGINRSRLLAANEAHADLLRTEYLGAHPGLELIVVKTAEEVATLPAATVYYTEGLPRDTQRALLARMADDDDMDIRPAYELYRFRTRSET